MTEVDALKAYQAIVERDDSGRVRAVNLLHNGDPVPTVDLHKAGLELRVGHGWKGAFVALFRRDSGARVSNWVHCD